MFEALRLNFVIFIERSSGQQLHKFVDRKSDLNENRLPLDTNPHTQYKNFHQLIGFLL